MLIPSSAGAAAPRTDTLLEWYDITATTIGVITGSQQAVGRRAALAALSRWRGRQL